MKRMPPWWPMMEPPLPSEEPVVTEDEQLTWDTSRTAAMGRLFGNPTAVHEGKSAVWVSDPDPDDIDTEDCD